MLRSGGAPLSHLISQPYEQASLIITTDLKFSEWGQQFGDPKMAATLLGRIAHHCNILETGNDPYRYKHRKTGIKTQQPTTPSGSFSTPIGWKLFNAV